MSLNSNAIKIIKEMTGNLEALKIETQKLDCGAQVLDCGVETSGSFEAGRLFSLVCIGGLGELSISCNSYGGRDFSTVEMKTDSPRKACIGSQKAGWKIKVGDFFGMGSGPARLLLEGAEFKEDSDSAVLAVECSTLPGDDVAYYVSEKTGTNVEEVIILVARTASIVGSTQVSARMVETALFKMDHLKVETEVVRASGEAPIAPIIGDDTRMMGVTNDMIIYGSTVYLEINGDLDLGPIPSSSSPDYGLPFIETFKNSGYDFYKIDHGIFAPAEIHIKDKNTGKEKRAGKINTEMIYKTLS